MASKQSVLANYTASSRQKVSCYAKSIKDQNGVLLGNAKDILGRWREYFKDLFNPVTIAPPITHEVHLGEENTINATEVFFAVTH